MYRCAAAVQKPRKGLQNRSNSGTSALGRINGKIPCGVHNSRRDLSARAFQTLELAYFRDLGDLSTESEQTSQGSFSAV